MRTLVEVITKSSERYFFILNFMSEHFDAWEFLIFQSKLKKKDIEIKKKKINNFSYTFRASIIRKS